MRRFLSVVAVCVGAMLVIAAPATAGVANQGVPRASSSNPLAGLRWGVYKGQYYNSIYPNYAAARGHDRQLLARIALQPLMFWFGAWVADDQAKHEAQDLIASVTQGNPNVLS